jgi:hypothetical protein
MAFSKLVGTFTITTANAAGTEISSETITKLSKFDWITVDADLVGITGGTLDVYLQREIQTGVWADWAHFPQLAAAAAAINYSCNPIGTLPIVAIGLGTLAAPGVALAANSCLGGHPGDKLRAIFVSGVGASAGAAQKLYVTGWCSK